MSAKLSESEAALYDRQIRLWGVESQNRLRNAKVLISGLKGTSAELCKNLVLAGVGITIHDDANVVVEDLGAQFFLTSEDIGKNRALASQSKIQELNPLVTVSTLTNPLKEFTKDDIAKFDVVCLCSTSVEDIKFINELCRETDGCFFALMPLGLSGILFLDLGQKYTCVETKHVKDADDQKQKKSVQVELTYPTFSTALSQEWSKFPAKKRKRVPDEFFAIQNIGEADFEKTLDQLMEGVKDGVVDKQRVMKVIEAGKKGAEVSPVCAVMGGIAGQEVMKAISRKDKPIQNFFFFNGIEAKGTVRLIGAA